MLAHVRQHRQPSDNNAEATAKRQTINNNTWSSPDAIADTSKSDSKESLACFRKALRAFSSPGFRVFTFLVSSFMALQKMSVHHGFSWLFTKGIWNGSKITVSEKTLVKTWIAVNIHSPGLFVGYFWSFLWWLWKKLLMHFRELYIASLRHPFRDLSTY